MVDCGVGCHDGLPPSAAGGADTEPGHDGMAEVGCNGGHALAEAELNEAAPSILGSPMGGQVCGGADGLLPGAPQAICSPMDWLSWAVGGHEEEAEVGGGTPWAPI